MKKISLSKKAFTMPELMIAIFILVIGIGSLIAAFVNCLWLNEQAANLTAVTSHAEHVLEEIRDTEFSQIASTDWDAWIENEGIATLSQESIAVSVSGTDPLTITVTVNWLERSRNKTESFTTEVTQ